MIVFLVDVIDLRAGRSIPFNAHENIIFFIVAVPKQLYEEEIGSRLKKNELFPVCITSSGSILEDHQKAYGIATGM